MSAERDMMCIAVPRSLRGGYDVFARVDGTIKAGGHCFNVVNGQGVREHIVVGQERIDGPQYD